MDLPTVLTAFLIILMIVLALFFASLVRSRGEIDQLKNELNKLMDEQHETPEDESDL